MPSDKVESVIKSRHRRRLKECSDLSALLWGALRRRAWQSAGELLRAISDVFDLMPIDFMKGAVEVIRRRFSADRICTFLRQVQTIQDKKMSDNHSVQTKFYRAFIVAEVAFHLCRSGQFLQAFENMKAATIDEKFSSMALFHAYTGILGTEVVNNASDPTSPEHRTILSDAVEALRKTLELEPDCDIAVHYLADVGERYPHLDIDIIQELDQFTTQNPDNPYGRRLLFEHLKRLGHYHELFDDGFEAQMLDPASAAFNVLAELYQEHGFNLEQMASLCMHRLQYTLYDLTAWRTLAALLPRLGDSFTAEPWWFEMHFRHPRTLARELGLPFDEPDYIGVNLPVLCQEESYEPLEALVFKTICAGCLLPEKADSRFVVETIRALSGGRQMSRIDRIRHGIAQASKSKRKRASSGL